MKITLCGSVAFINEMEQVAKQLEALGYEVKFPPLYHEGERGEAMPTLDYYHLKKEVVHDKNHWIWKRHDEPMRDHFEKVAWSDAILVLNYEKNGVAGYVGPNTLIEMGLAFWLKKTIFLLNEIPQLAYTEEILGLKPRVLNGDISLLNSQ